MTDALTWVSRGAWKLVGVAGVALILVATTASIGIATSSEASTSPPTRAEPAMSAQQLHALLGERADAGSQEAAELRQAIDAYLAERDLTLQDLPPPVKTVEHVNDGPIKLRLEGFEPWSLSIHNDTRIADADQLAAYRDLRHAALRSMAQATPDRVIEVAVTPDDLVAVPELLEAIGCDCAIERSRADVWRDRDWVIEVGTLTATAADRLQPALEEQVSSSLDLYAELSLDDLDLSVRQLRFRLPAEAAAGLIDVDHVLLVDPLTDIQDRFADRAALVDLTNVPDVFRAYAEYELGRELVPGAVTPELQSADAEEAPLWRGQWDTEAELSIEPRTGAAVAVAPGIPHGVVLWGGVTEDGRLLNDGVLIDSADPYHWRVMPESPLVPRRDFGWASYGDLVYVWGGVDASGQPLDDGAEYQHGWTMLPGSSLPVGPAAMTVVDGRLWVVATDPGSGLARVQSLRISMEDGGSWGPVADVPLPAGERYEVLGCCRDEANELIVFSVQADGSAVAASWDIGAAHAPSFVGDEWTQLGAVPAPTGGPVVGRAIEQQLAAWVGSSGQASQGGETGDLAVLREVGYGGQHQWQTAPAPGPLDVASGLVLSPRHLISVSDRVAYDLADERWLRLPERHRRAMFGTPTGATAWWDRGRLWVFGGVAPDGTMRSDLWSFAPRLPKGTYKLPIGSARLYQRRNGECITNSRPGTWTLRGDPRARPRVWMQKGSRKMTVTMPDGWHATFGPRLAITDSTGTVRFREGDACEGNTGTGG